MTRTEFNALNKSEKKEAKLALYSDVKDALEGKGTKDELLEKISKAKDAMKILRPSLYGESTFGGGVAAKHVEFTGMFKEIGDTVDEMQLFKELKVGRKEARNMIKQSIRKSAPDERKWIHFDAEIGLYGLVDTGAEAPDDWTGYIPVEEMDAPDADGDDLL